MNGLPQQWHVCPVCGLAGWAREGRNYCLIHGEPPEEDPFGERPLTAIELALGRRILTDPPSLHDWIRKFGGYARITAEGWAEYDRAMADSAFAESERGQAIIRRARP